MPLHRAVRSCCCAQRLQGRLGGRSGGQRVGVHSGESMRPCLPADSEPSRPPGPGYLGPHRQDRARLPTSATPAMRSLAVLPAAGQGRRRGAGMPRLLSALHPRASQYVTGSRPEAERNRLIWVVRAIHVSGPNENRPRDAVVRDSPPPRILWLVRSDEYPHGWFRLQTGGRRRWRRTGRSGHFCLGGHFGS